MLRKLGANLEICGLCSNNANIILQTSSYIMLWVDNNTQVLFAEDRFSMFRSIKEECVAWIFTLVSPKVGQNVVYSYVLLSNNRF